MELRPELHRRSSLPPQDFLRDPSTLQFPHLHSCFPFVVFACLLLACIAFTYRTQLLVHSLKMADLQELLARLTSNDASNASRPQNPATTTAYAEPSVSSPLVSPPLSGPQPRHASAIMVGYAEKQCNRVRPLTCYSPQSPTAGTPSNATPAGDSRSNNLLNLLKFGQPAATSPQPTSALSFGAQSPQPFADLSQSQPAAGAGKPPGSAASNHPAASQDPFAAFGRQPSTSSLRSQPVASPVTAKPGVAPSASAGSSSQAYLLNLLNQGKPAEQSRTSSLRSLHADTPVPSVENAAPDVATHSPMQEFGSPALEASTFSLQVDRKSSPFHISRDGSASRGATPSAPSDAPKQRGPIFSAVDPFEQLHASSPRNQTPLSSTHNASQSPQVGTLRGGHDATTHSDASARETVSDAVNEVGAQVEKEVEQALAAAIEDPREFQKVIQQGAAELKQELKDDKLRKEVQEVLGKPMTEAIEEVADELAADTAGDSWESADALDSPSPKEIEVYNFPMKPFVSLEVRAMARGNRFKADGYNTMARLKKDFDQNDRNLVDANERYFTYVSPKHGGFRVVRQTDGANKHIFGESKERLCNIALASTTKQMGETDAVLATGVDGTVYWTLLSTDGNEQFSDDLMERSFILPPFPVQDDNTSGGQLKTRARKSSKNPNYFAVGRGKAIHIIWPNIANTSKYTDMKTHICDSEKYLKQRSLKISTGKAGKDFTFSQCDTVIVSLDKTGKMRFWDIRPLIAPANGEPGELAPVEVRIPILTLATTSPTNKSWPTSVMFLDKERPHNKGIALRYLIVGMKQNHTLQLWDLCLGKAVQEINLPHDNESDGICSVAYHPQSGIISIGHPTRNTIYFIHLSAPRYLLPAMSQAKFLERTVAKDPSLPKIESTAIMTGLREYSFEPYGELRSFEILSDPSAVTGASNDGTLFDLYVMHSKGVCTLTIKRGDLGWSADNTVLHPVDAVKYGCVEVSELKPIDAPEPSEPSVNGDSSSKKGKAVKEPSTAPSKRDVVPGSKTSTIKNDTIARTLDRVEAKQDAARAAVIEGLENVAPRAEKIQKKKNGNMYTQVGPEPTPLPAPAVSAKSATEAVKVPIRDSKPIAAPASYAKAAASAAPPSTRELDAKTSTVTPTSDVKGSGFIGEEGSNALKQLEDNVTASLSRLFNAELSSLYRRVDEDKRVQDAAGAAKQDAVLRLVSSTLTENVEKSLGRIVSSSLESALLPSLSKSVADIVERKLVDITRELTDTISKQHHGAVNEAMVGAFRDATFQQTISQQMAPQINSHIENHLSNAINKSITPAFTNMTVNAVQQIAGDLEQRMLHVQHQVDAQLHQDALKIDQLTTLVRSLTETVHTMSSAQARLLHQVSELQQHLAATPSSSRAEFPTSTAVSEKQAVRSPVKSAEELEADEMRALITNGSFEGAVGKWVQSSRQVYLFSEVLSRCNPQYVTSLSPLVALSATAALTQPLEPNMAERLAWLEAILEVINPRDGEIGELVPRIMEIVSQRLQSCYMQLAEKEDRSPLLKPLLKRIVTINNRAQSLMKAALGG